MTQTHAFGTVSQQPGQPGASIQIEREISEDEFNSYVDSLRMFESLTNRGAFSLMSRSHSNIRMMIQAVSNVEKYGGEFRRIDKSSITAALMAELTNWLAATRLYLENERDFVLRNFGDGSEEMASYKSAASTAFDTYEGYRFLYNLRDYTQHCGIPVGYLNVSGIRPDTVVEVSLDRSHLLASRFRWSKHAKALLNGWPVKIPVLPLMDEAMEGYSGIEERMLRINLQRCIEVAPACWRSFRGSTTPAGIRPCLRCPDLTRV